MDDTIPSDLPLLDAFLAERAPEGEPLGGADLVLIQHQLGSQVPMTEALLRLGADPSRLHWIDIPYTSNALVRESLQRLGIPAANLLVSDYSLEQPYAWYQRRRVQEMVAAVAHDDRAEGPVLVLDDGSYFVEALSCFDPPRRDVRIVEQTTRGIIRIDSDPAVREYVSYVGIKNVAQSAPKKDIEGPLIGEAVCRAMSDRLVPVLAGGRAPEALVLGYGQIGRSVIAALESVHGLAPDHIWVADPSPRAQEAARSAGHRAWDRSAPGGPRFGLVIGCSGTTSFGIGDRVFLEDGAVLASASSGSAELSREAFIELADSHPADRIYVHDRDALATAPLHSDIRIHLVDRDVTFLNGGFPVNFDGGVNSVPPRYIQATHALQVGAACEVLATEERGLLPLGDDLCAWVTRRFRELVPEA